MSSPGEIERATQNRIVELFQKDLDYDYLGKWEDRPNNSNIEEELLTAFLDKQGYTAAQISQAIFQLRDVATNFAEGLYTTNKNVYEKLRYGVKVQVNAGENTETIHLFDWTNPENNDFAIAEEVTIHGEHDKRPDIVLYVNGLAVGILELKRASVDIGEAIRQNIGNQQERFVQPFFSTIQLLFAGSDSEGLRYGTIGTPEAYYLSWKEDVEDQSKLTLDKYLIRMCRKDRLIDLLHDFVLFDAGWKKLPRVHQYFGMKAAQDHVRRYEGGIIWHTQGSGKSITMVLLTKWILENNPNARVLVLTDRTELDKQIQDVFEDAGETIHRTRSGKDLLFRLSEPKPRLICSLVHKFGRKDVTNFNEFIRELGEQEVPVHGELFVLVDECHRTQSGRLHKTMKAILQKAVFIGFTGTPLLKQDKQTSQEVFGKYIHTYKFHEGVEDRVILDLVYEARDVDQRLSSPQKVEQWFEAKTKGLNDFQKSEIKKKWGTMQSVLSSRSRMDKIVSDIILDFGTKPVLSSQRGNAMLVAHSILEACMYYELFQKTEFRGKCGLITSYSPYHGDVSKEDTGANTDTQKEYIYNLYTELLKDVTPKQGKSKTETYEDWAKEKFKKEPVNMKVLVVVSKLLTGFDAPSCTYLYLDKKMQDHGLFQAICRTNRLDGEDKEFGYIIDYRDLFDQVGAAISVYTSELDTEDFELKDIEVMMQDRLVAGKKRLDDALEAVALLCEPVPAPKGKLEYQRYFCGNVEVKEALKETEVRRNQLYKSIVALIRAYAAIADEMEDAGYTPKEIESIKKEVDSYLKLREEIRLASGETIDLKKYEADMRHLIDTYIQAEESEVISPFDGLSMLDILENEGVQAVIDAMPSGVRRDRSAVSEIIERNVRKKIIKDHNIDPAYFEKISKLLDELIRARRDNAITYAEYLKRIAELARQVNKGTNDGVPSSMKTKGMQSLYNNFSEDEELIIRLDQVLKTQCPADWRGTKAKEQMVKGAIYNLLKSMDENGELKNISEEPKEHPYGYQKAVDKVFSIIEQHQEY
ncbi:type I restriction endonuclease subunit R [Marinoscillum sp.]|uniref:type I restriction endonuclease subunit R n=1 Tax=Marinoscillum sp. TaxID=2024838 RepID=UPI003BA93E06